MTKLDMVEKFQEMGLMENVKTFDFALPMVYLDSLVDFAVADEYSSFYGIEKSEVYGHFVSRFVYAYYVNNRQGLYCIFPDSVGQELIEIIGRHNS